MNYSLSLLLKLIYVKELYKLREMIDIIHILILFSKL